MDDPAVRTVGLRKAYGPVTVLDGVDLEVAAGTVCALLGPNGAGKTTVVRILATLLPPSGGTAEVLGRDVVGDARAVRAGISLTGQFAAVDELLTAEENLLMMGRLRHLGRAERRRRTDELLALLELTGAARRRVRTFSGGMRRKVDLAMSLVGRPRLLFLDEPTTGLDPRSRQAVWDVVEELVRTGVTVFLTTQYLDEADRLADRIAVLDAGRLVATGSAAELKRRVGTEQVELRLPSAAAAGAARRLLGDAVLPPATTATPRGAGPGTAGAGRGTDGDGPGTAGAGRGTDKAGPGTDGAGPDGAVLVRVATDGSARHLRWTLDTLAAAEVEVLSVALRQPTLDDVFLTLTGGTREPAVAR